MSIENMYLPVNDDKVTDLVIDIYLGFCMDLNTAEVIRLGEQLIKLANRKATDVELVYRGRYPDVVCSPVQKGNVSF